MTEINLRDSPAISIVMLSYNNAEFTSDAIASALDQDVELEIIVVDDFSTDGSPNLIRKWIERDNRVRAIFHDRNLGIAASANDGIESTCGRYIGLASTDDMFKPRTLGNVVKLMDSNEEIGAVILDGECIDSNNRRLGFAFSEWHGKPPVSEGYFFRYLIRGNFVCTGIVRKRIIEATGVRYNRALKYVNDWLFWLELSHSNKFVYFDQPVYRYRIHPNALSASSKGFAGDARVYEIILEKYGNELDPQTKGHILRNMGVGYWFMGEFRKARLCLYQSLKAYETPLAKLGVVSLIALSHQMRLMRFWVGLWRQRHPYRILASWRRR